MGRTYKLLLGKPLDDLGIKPSFLWDSSANHYQAQQEGSGSSSCSAKRTIDWFIKSGDMACWYDLNFPIQLWEFIPKSSVHRRMRGELIDKPCSSLPLGRWSLLTLFRKVMISLWTPERHHPPCLCGKLTFSVDGELLLSSSPWWKVIIFGIE